MTVLRPHDVLVLLALVARESEPFSSFAEVAAQTGISIGEVHKSLARADAAHLYRSATRRVEREALHMFLTGGVQYAFPAARGALVRGVPTGVAAPPLADAFNGQTLPPDLTPVWPSPTGTRRGYTIEPLYRTAPEIAERDPALYELLALTDAVREGRARERGDALWTLTTKIFG